MNFLQVWLIPTDEHLEDPNGQVIPALFQVTQLGTLKMQDWNLRNWNLWHKYTQKCINVQLNDLYQRISMVFVCAVAPDSGQAGIESLSYGLCVDKVLHMQRVFLTERESADDAKNLSQCTVTTAPAAGASGTEAGDASTAASSSLTQDTATSSHISALPVDETNGITSPVQTVPSQQVDLSN